MPEFFTERGDAIALRALGAPNRGFRPGQLGALHAVVSHFPVFDEPAIVSLPTGYGKTAVIMALPFVLRARRLLVVEPSDVLRRQTAAHFDVLATLRKLDVLADETPNPAVKGVRTRKCNLCPFRANEWGTHAARIELSFRRGLSEPTSSGAARFQV